MATSVTGDFDLVAAFSVPAVNRVLAAMHSNGRFLHSISAHIDDNTPVGNKVPRPVLVGSVDEFGQPLANQGQIGHPDSNPGKLVATDAVYAGLDLLVNGDLLVSTTGTLEPSQLSGRLQAQLFPPAISIPDASGTNVTVSLEMLSRYLADPKTAPLAEFVRGVLQVTASVDQVTSQTADVLEIDFKAQDAIIQFLPSWSSSPLSAEDLAGINLAIRNALQTSFLPSNVTLPSGISYAQLKTLSSPLPGVAVLLNTQSGPGNPASLSSNFLAGQDNFAFAISQNYIANAFAPVINGILSQPPFTIVIPVDLLFTTAHVVYSIQLNSADVQLQAGKIVLTVQGHATQTSNKWYAPGSFDFTATFSFGLQADGSTADLVPLDVSLNTSSWIVNLFQGSATAGITQVRDQALEQSGAYAIVRDTLDANKNLGGFFSGLLSPPSITALVPGEEVVLSYTAAEIQPGGIVLHGALTAEYVQPHFALGGPVLNSQPSAPVGSWPPAYVQFQQIPPSPRRSPVGVLPTGPSYSALKTYIPGGTINNYEWNVQGVSLVDSHRFIYSPPQLGNAGAFASVGVTPVLSIPAFSPVCLTVQGSRLSPSGAVVDQPVTASICTYSNAPIIPVGLASEFKDALPTVALTQPGPGGQVVVTGHTAILADHYGIGTPNLLVHFPDDNGIQELQVLTDALTESNRPYVSTAIIAPLTPEQLEKAKHANGVIYGDSPNGEWERLFQVSGKKRPFTMIVTADGKIAWQADGPLDRAALAAALRQYLAFGPPALFDLFQANLGLGRPAPNFLFEYAPGRQLTLRKISGRPAVLVFWKVSSQPSIQAVRDLQQYPAQNGTRPLVLAINDGDPEDVARRVAMENKLTATIVTDPQREISSAYGVSVWPTIISLDASGYVTAIRHGRDTGHHAMPDSAAAVTTS